MNRVLNVSTVFGADTLRFSSLTGDEEISRLFDLELHLKSEQRGLDPNTILGTSVTVDIELPEGRRYLNGQCTEFEQISTDGQVSVYRARLKPWLWYGTRRKNYRIFQHLTAPDMVKQILGNYPFPSRFLLTRNYRTWDYCVQYRETDANFVMRMFENEGIWFWFEHSGGEHALVITDDIGLANPFPGYASVPYYGLADSHPDEDHLSSWSAGSTIKSGQYMTRDYNFTMPRSDLATSRDQSGEHAHGSYEVFDYPGGYADFDEGEDYARVRAEELQSRHRRSRANGTARGIAPGYLFTLSNHPDPKQNREYLVVATQYDFTDNDYQATDGASGQSLQILLQTHPSDQPFRPERLTLKPQTKGPDTATVTGPKGQELYTDEYGRVKVSFPWNRYCSKDENSSCWIRVSHPWAGANFGGMHLPRIGQEVLVDYLNGDPDRPVIVSRLYNAFQMPPWDLPANATQSGILTRSSQGGGYDNANALRFEDKKGEEQLWIHAEKNQDIEVENDETHWVGNDRSKTIDRDETSHIKRDRTETVDRHETITVHGNRKEEVDGNETIDIHKNRTETVDGNETITIHQNRTETVDGNEKITIHQDRHKTVDGNETVQIDQNKAETILLASLQNVGLGRMDNIGLGFSVNVGAAMNTVVGLHQGTQVGKDKTTTVGDTYSLTAGGGSNITMDKDSITLTVGKSQMTMKSDGTILLNGHDYHIGLSGEHVTKADSTITIKGAKILEN